MFKKKRYENTVEYKILGKTFAKKTYLPYGYFIKLKNKIIYKKINTEKLITHYENKAHEHLTSILSSVKHTQMQLEYLDKKTNILNSVQSTHREVFSPFKNKYPDKEIVLMATGPTLKKYLPIENALHIGVNNAYKFQAVKLDFLFIQDVLGLKDQMEDINAYGLGQCHKFYGDVLFCDHCAIPESDVIKANAKRYYTGGMGSPFLHDIASCLMPDFGSVVFPALSFALYTNPKRIYLVGCDCSELGYFDSSNPNVSPSLKHDMPRILEGWDSFKSFAEHFYPETEIISINPIGLKGLFKDVTTQ